MILTKSFLTYHVFALSHKIQSSIFDIENQLNYSESDLLWKILDYENNFYCENFDKIDLKKLYFLKMGLIFVESYTI